MAWIGDYALKPYEPEKDAYAKALPFLEFQKFYQIAHNRTSSLTQGDFKQADLDALTHETKGMCLANHSKKLFLDLTEYIYQSTNVDDWCINPLPLLTACGNNRGSGDFRSSCIGFEHVGTWAFDWLEYADKAPDGYCKSPIYFSEESKIY